MDHSFQQIMNLGKKVEKQFIRIHYAHSCESVFLVDLSQFPKLCFKEWRWFRNNVKINCFVKQSFQSKIPLKSTFYFNYQIIHSTLYNCVKTLVEILLLFIGKYIAPSLADSRHLQALFTSQSTSITVEHFLNLIFFSGFLNDFYVQNLFRNMCN